LIQYNDIRYDQKSPNWRIDNIIPMLMVVGSFFIYLVRLSIVETKLDTVIVQQRELVQEFRSWKVQAETRWAVENEVAILKSHHSRFVVQIKENYEIKNINSVPTGYFI